jgi:hypothetical protein
MTIEVRFTPDPGDGHGIMGNLFVVEDADEVPGGRIEHLDATVYKTAG